MAYFFLANFDYLPLPQCAFGELRREDTTGEMFQPDTEMLHCKTCVLALKHSTPTQVNSKPALHGLRG